MEQRLLDFAGSLMREAFLKTAEESLNIARKDVISMMRPAMMRLIGSFAGNFIVATAMACLKALGELNESNDVLKAQVTTLVRAALLTGIDRLRVATRLEPQPGSSETEEQMRHRISRYRDALNSFDEALSQSDEFEKPAIHLLRGLISLRIPGGEQEARIHLEEFRFRCNDLEREFELQRETEERAASLEQANADQVIIPSGSPGGGGLVGMDTALPRHKKRQLEYNARIHRLAAIEAKTKVDKLQAYAETASILIQLAQAKGQVFGNLS